MSFKLIQGEVLDVLKTMEDSSIDMTFTSPPYNIDLSKRKDTNIAHYDSIEDNLSWEDYCKWQIDILNEIYHLTKKEVC